MDPNNTVDMISVPSSNSSRTGSSRRTPRSNKNIASLAPNNTVSPLSSLNGLSLSDTTTPKLTLPSTTNPTLNKPIPVSAPRTSPIPSTLSQIPGYSPLSQTSRNVNSMPPLLPTVVSPLTQDKTVLTNTHDRLTGYGQNLPDTLNIIPSEQTLNSDTFSDYSNLIDEHSVEQELANKGYIVQDKLLTRDIGGITAARFIKAINPRGQLVYIEMDTDGYVTVQPSDPTLMESKTASTIPYSIKMGSYENAGTQVSGIVIECENGICTLTRNTKTLDPEEKNFIIPDNGTYNILKAEGQPVPYPVIKFSEIKTNPSIVLSNVDQSVARMRDYSYSECRKRFTNLKQTIQGLWNTVSSIDEKQTNAYKQLTNSIAELKVIQEQYKNIKLETASEIDKQKYRKVIYNLSKRNELVVDLFRICEEISDYNDNISSVSSELSKIESLIDSEFKNLNYVMD